MTYTTPLLECLPTLYTHTKIITLVSINSYLYLELYCPFLEVLSHII